MWTCSESQYSTRTLSLGDLDLFQQAGRRSSLFWRKTLPFPSKAVGYINALEKCPEKKASVPLLSNVQKYKTHGELSPSLQWLVNISITAEFCWTEML